MQIRSIRATPVNIPFVAPYRFSYGSISSVTKTVVEIKTGDGITGLGECADGDRSADVMAMAPRLAGLDIRDAVGQCDGGAPRLWRDRDGALGCARQERGRSPASIAGRSGAP
jgi:glucarate dehydratase